VSFSTFQTQKLTLSRTGFHDCNFLFCNAFRPPPCWGSGYNLWDRFISALRRVLVQLGSKSITICTTRFPASKLYVLQRMWHKGAELHGNNNEWAKILGFSGGARTADIHLRHS
jgi:hypothetical protein